MRSILGVLAMMFLLQSCGKNIQTVTTKKVSSGSALKDKYAGGFSYGNTDGQVRSNSDKTSDFAGKQFNGTSSYSKSKYGRKSYNGSQSWAGTKSYGNKSYQGNTGDGGFKRTSSHGNNQSSYSGSRAEANGRNYGTKRVEKVSATQNSADRFGRPTSNYGSRNNLEDPVMLGRGSQNGVSLNQTRELLGRNDP